MHCPERMRPQTLFIFLVALAIGGAALADAVAVKHTEGLVHGFLACGR